MQRAAAASEAAHSPSTPQSAAASSSLPITPDSIPQTPSQPGSAVTNGALGQGDAAAVRAAVAEGDAKRRRALDRHARDDGAETKWAFSYRSREAPPPAEAEALRVEIVGYEGLGVAGNHGAGSGRMRFGKFTGPRKRMVGNVSLAPFHVPQNALP